jgi:hypothetical protein
MITRTAPGSSSDNMLSHDGSNAIGSNEGMDMEEHEIVFDEAVIHKIVENQSFIANTVSHIMQNTNLSELVTEVNAIKTENRELRSILNSQHEMMNGMNALLFTLLNQMHHDHENKTKNEQPQEAESVSSEITLEPTKSVVVVEETLACSNAIAEQVPPSTSEIAGEVAEVTLVVEEESSSLPAIPE